MIKHIPFERSPNERELERFWIKVYKFEDETKCWFWIGADGDNGYGKHRYDKKLYQSHRVAYFFTYKEDPGELQIDHACNNSMCCNPNHLVALTGSENFKKMFDLLRQYGPRTHCLQGHELTEDNIVRASNSRKLCLKCKELRYNLALDFRKVRPSKCIKGHTYTEDNAFYRKNGAISCKECLRIRNKERLQYKLEWQRKKKLRLKEKD